MKTSGKGRKTVIDKVGITEDTLTGRAGLSLYVKYLAGIGVHSQLERFFGTLRRNQKGRFSSSCFAFSWTAPVGI